MAESPKENLDLPAVTVRLNDLFGSKIFPVSQDSPQLFRTGFRGHPFLVLLAHKPNDAEITIVRNGQPIVAIDKRKEFFTMLEDILDYQVERVIITFKDRVSRVGFELFSYLFQKYATEIVVISEVGSPKVGAEEVFEEIVALVHCYSMKLYSKRRKKSIEVSLDQ